MNASQGKFEPFPQVTKHGFAFGLTYEGHMREAGERPAEPVIFDKNCAPDVEPDSVPVPTVDLMYKVLEDLDADIAQRLRSKLPDLPALFDYEVEVGFVLLEPVTPDRCKDPSWMPRIGYFLLNDLTARSVQIAGQLAADRLPYWSASKSLPDCFAVAANMFVPDAPSADAFPDVTLTLKVNGKTRQHEKLSDIVHSPRALLDFAARTRADGCLDAGDMILTGTPGGVAIGMSKAKQLMAKLLPASLVVPIGIKSSRSNPDFLKPGDVVEQSADWLGSFTFKVQ